MPTPDHKLDFNVSFPTFVLHEIFHVVSKLDDALITEVLSIAALINSY